MNGGVANIFQTDEATGSKKRKRGLAPKKTLQEKAELKLSVQLTNPKIMEPPILQNGHHNQVEQHLCSICGQKSGDEMVNISDKTITNEEFNAPNISSECTLNSICVQCVEKVDAQKDSIRTGKNHLQGAPNGQMCNYKRKPKKTQDPMHVVNKPNGQTQEGVLKEAMMSTCTSETSRNNCLEVVKAVPKNNNLCGSDSNQKKCLILSNPPEITSIITITSSTSTGEESRIMNNKSSSATSQLCSSVRGSLHSIHSVDTQQQSMLEVYCVHSESALITESGGKVNNYEQKSDTPKTLICQHCGRAYSRKYYYGRHMRHCHTRYRNLSMRKKSKSAIYIRCSDMDADMPDNVKYEPLFHCTDCSFSCHSIVILRKHKRSCHLQIFECDICNSEYTTAHEYDFHRTICEAKNEVLKNSYYVTDDDDELSTYTTIGRMTRARSRALTQIPTRITDLDSENEDFNKGDFNTDDTDDDEVSVADTMYSNRMRFTGDWVEDHSNMLEYSDMLDYEQQISSYKEYDLYLLDRLKDCIDSNIFICFVPDCSFRTYTLPSLMMHDYVDHFRHAWFHCKKCGCVFTRKVFLDYHLDRQNSGRFICFQCGDIFEFQHELNRHQILHTKSVNYHCNYCNFDFLTKRELLQHCEMEQHNPHGIRHLIHYDPDMTIVNPVPKATVYERGTYAEKICIMKLPETVSKRPIELHKPYRRKIGDVLFKNQKNPNCWGWK
ncbi:PR domain zinc finger protein 15-like [Teleopsis dalmanni]|uniref:PR domain zinc finger protein 15-like n=1 Tax=Teleopsis dalmanni TaxID=139649 RepID=UPI0018CE57C5|nr:PR domain zinc finger protein 15-like [Teleopsis dalmanni]